MTLINRIFKAIAKAPVIFYKGAISPLIGPRCRFEPTCSSYALEAIEKHGALKGLYLGLRRFGKCHPLHKGTHFDPVPERFDWPRLMGYKRGRKSKQE